MAERRELNIEELEDVAGGALRSQLYEGQTEGKLTSTKLNKTYHYDPKYHNQIGDLIRTSGISEKDKVQKMLDKGWIY